jgi:RhoGEF domain
MCGCVYAHACACMNVYERVCIYVNIYIYECTCVILMLTSAYLQSMVCSLSSLHKCICVLLYTARKAIYTEREILETEQSFIEDITTLLTCFSVPLLKKKLITEDEATSVFGNADVLLSEHRIFCTLLQKTYRQSRSLSSVFLLEVGSRYAVIEDGD